MARHHKFKTVEEMEIKINEYFEMCDNHTITKTIKGKKGEEDTIVEVNDPQPYTVPGLAVYLGYATRFSIQDLKEHKRFSQVIKKALGRIENQRLQQALTRKRSEPVSIFDLKCNFGYQEKQQLELTGPGGGPIAITAFPPEPGALEDWEKQIVQSRKRLEIEDKTKPTSNQKDGG